MKREDLQDTLEEVIELLGGYVDVKDSDNGPVANNAMLAVQILQDLIKGGNVKSGSSVLLGRCAIHGNDPHRLFPTCKDFSPTLLVP